MPTETNSLFDQLSLVQSKLKAPKSNFNSFANYSYRSQEDILEAVKPLLAETNLVLTVSDNIVMLGERYYVEAVATLRYLDQEFSITAYAREEDNRKGMTSDQLTGATSSYARKYALNGLFLIDDTKDSDATNEHSKTTKTPKTAALPGVTALENTLAPTIQTKLGNAVKLKGFTEKQQIVNVLNNLSEAEFGVKVFLYLNEQQAETLATTIAKSPREALEMMSGDTVA